MTQLLERPLDPPSPAPARARAAVRGFRPDIEGLRAVAVLAVVAYHAAFGVCGGYVGVDVFFVISGYLITRQLLAATDARGLRALPSFYVRRIRRLLPASTVVVLVTLLAAREFASPLQLRSIAVDGVFTTFYGLNYRLAYNGTQYLHEHDAVSPLQHFWSLGVEEQFYACWPLLVVGALLVGRGARRRVLAAALLVLAAASFAASVTVTGTLASWAYFSLHTRGWELAVGALVALAAPTLTRMPRRVAGALGWLGLAGILAAAFGYSDATPYPGSAAALPVLATAAVIAAGCGSRRGVERVLGEPAMQCVGRISYGWYLWHWPMLVVAPMAVGHPLTAVQRLIVVWLSFVTAIATYFLVEERFRHGRPARAGRPAVRLTLRRGFATGLGLTTAVACCAALVVATAPSLRGSGAAVTVAQSDVASAGVFAGMDAALVAGVSTTSAPRNLTPAPQDAARDLPAADGTDCHADFRTVHQGSCVWGDPAGAHTVVLLGDSHADMWLGAFDRAGKAEHWKVVDWTKSACPAADITVRNSTLNRTYTECDEWRRDVLARIDRLHPDLVVLSGSENLVGPSVSPQAWSGATLRTLEHIRSGSGARAVLLQDVPVPAYDVPSCVAAHLDSVRDCTFPESRGYSFPARHRALATDAAAAGFEVVEPRPWICTDGTCPAVVGNLLVYRDDTHLTATFGSWLAPRVSTLLRAG